MARFYYTLLLFLLSPFIFIWLIFKYISIPEFRINIIQRFGFISKISGKNILIHCASVGELKAATSVINNLLVNYPQHNIVITTTTPTGRNLALKTFNDKIHHLYLPVDIPFIINHFISVLNPCIAIILEREIWPNLLYALKSKNIPILLINARLSNGSAKRYLSLAPKLIKEALSSYTYIATQNSSSLQRFIQLGANPESISNMGNIKFDISSSADINNNIADLIPNRKTIVFASTHKGEDELIISKLSSLDEFPALVVIVPRHPKRFETVYNLAVDAGLSVIKRSSNSICNSNQILLGDSMDEMFAYFVASDIVFMGGSLDSTGGHNMLEPALLSKPIIFGPNVHNFKDIASDLIEKDASLQVNNVDELFDNVIDLINNPVKCSYLGNNANKYLMSNQGSVDKISILLKKFI